MVSWGGVGLITASDVYAPEEDGVEAVSFSGFIYRVWYG